MRRSYHLLVFGLLALALVLGASPALADGIVVVPCPTPFPNQPNPIPSCPRPPCAPDTRCPTPYNPLSIKYHRVDITIDNQIATTHVDQVFVNDGPVDLEGTYIFPLPVDATVKIGRASC